MLFEIKSRWTEKILFNLETSSLKLCIEAAVKDWVNLSRANLSRADLSGANLSGANLFTANLSRADLSTADLFRADLSGANLFGADLFSANLFGANLSRADLSGANLSRANLSRADLSGANLSRANLFTADLFRANLSGADLFSADLSGANLSGADIFGAKNLPRTLYSHNEAIALAPALFAYWNECSAREVSKHFNGISPDERAVCIPQTDISSGGFCYIKEPSTGDGPIIVWWSWKCPDPATWWVIWRMKDAAKIADPA